MRFEFATATHILFGPVIVCEVALLAASVGLRLLFVAGHTVKHAAPPMAQFIGYGHNAPTNLPLAMSSADLGCIPVWLALSEIDLPVVIVTGHHQGKHLTRW
jgi:hypothetical protein